MPPTSSSLQSIVTKLSWLRVCSFARCRLKLSTCQLFAVIQIPVMHAPVMRQDCGAARRRKLVVLPLSLKHRLTSFLKNGGISTNHLPEMSDCNDALAKCNKSPDFQPASLAMSHATESAETAASISGSRRRPGCDVSQTARV